ncbi:MAG TPA: hypothetical protein VIL71_07270 [Spirillospora sp.]
MLKDPLKLESIAARSWCRPGERLLMRIGPRWGHVAFDIGGRRGAPHDHGGRIAVESVTEPEWPLPTEVVAGGRCHGDEWVDDPTIWGHVQAAAPGHVAVGCADGLAAGRADAWLVLSNQRLAVVMAASAAERPEPAPQPSPSSKPARSAGGWLARVKDVAKDAQARMQSGGESLLTLWEAPGTVIHHFGALPLGRATVPDWFGQIAFHDGSSLVIRMENRVQAESVVTSGDKLFG